MRKFFTRRNIILAIIALVVVGGIGWSRVNSSRSKAEQETVRVERRDVEKTLVVSGTVQALKQATLNYPSAGKLAYINVVDGQQVNKGQSLSGLDRGDLSAAERAAYYRYLAADANAKEVEDDVKGNDDDETFTQKNIRVSAQTARDIAYDTWLTTRRALTNSSLYSPFAGVVTNLTANAVGDTVSLADGITVVDPESLYFEIEIDESDLGLVTIGMPVTVLLDAFEEEEFTGSLSFIGFFSQLSTTGATVFPARVSLPLNSLAKLRLGMNGDAEMVLEKAEGALSLPVESVVDNEVVLPGSDAKKSVETGVEGDEFIEIKGGLQEGDLVVR